MDYALYMRGLASFRGQRGYFHRLLRIDLTRRPPEGARESFSAFAQLLQRYPNSAYAADARQRMVYLRNRLAEYEVNVARYYVKRGAWLAASQRAARVVEQYDGAGRQVAASTARSAGKVTVTVPVGGFTVVRR